MGLAGRPPLGGVLRAHRSERRVEGPVAVQREDELHGVEEGLRVEHVLTGRVVDAADVRRARGRCELLQFEVEEVGPLRGEGDRVHVVLRDLARDRSEPVPAPRVFRVDIHGEPVGHDPRRLLMCAPVVERERVDLAVEDVDALDEPVGDGGAGQVDVIAERLEPSLLDEDADRTEAGVGRVHVRHLVASVPELEGAHQFARRVLLALDGEVGVGAHDALERGLDPHSVLVVPPLQRAGSAGRSVRVS